MLTDFGRSLCLSLSMILNWSARRSGEQQQQQQQLFQTGSKSDLSLRLTHAAIESSRLNVASSEAAPNLENCKLFNWERWSYASARLARHHRSTREFVAFDWLLDISHASKSALSDSIYTLNICTSTFGGSDLVLVLFFSIYWLTGWRRIGLECQIARQAMWEPFAYLHIDSPSILKSITWMAFDTPHTEPHKYAHTTLQSAVSERILAQSREAARA